MYPTESPCRKQWVSLHEWEIKGQFDITMMDWLRGRNAGCEAHVSEVTPCCWLWGVWTSEEVWPVGARRLTEVWRGFPSVGKTRSWLWDDPGAEMLLPGRHRDSQEQDKDQKPRGSCHSGAHHQFPPLSPGMAGMARATWDFTAMTGKASLERASAALPCCPVFRCLRSLLCSALSQRFNLIISSCTQVRRWFSPCWSNSVKRNKLLGCVFIFNFYFSSSLWIFCYHSLLLTGQISWHILP